jgi:hypothetical protein
MILNPYIKLQKLCKLGWTLAELFQDQQAFTDVFDVYLTRFGGIDNRDNVEDNDSDNELALYRIINPVALSLVKSSSSKVERYLSKPLLKKNNKKTYAEF